MPTVHAAAPASCVIRVTVGVPTKDTTQSLLIIPFISQYEQSHIVPAIPAVCTAVTFIVNALTWSTNIL